MASDTGNQDLTTMEFKSFAVVSNIDVSDHHYRDSYQSSEEKRCFGKKKVYDAIMKEWKILEKSLPAGIYVRAYDMRIELLRAVIVGSQGTPYQDGLFFIDILFPTDYPEHPPQLYSHISGCDVNPNIDDNGHFILSLLGPMDRWRYRENSEQWIPDQSTLLQILVSIQGLVLIDDPLYNHLPVSCRDSPFWRSSCIDFAQHAFIETHSALVQNLQTPPKYFESFVMQHFRSRGEFILAALEEYRIGSFRGEKVYAKIEGALKEMGENPHRKENVTQFEFTEHGALQEMADNQQRQDNATPPVIPAEPSGGNEGNAYTSLESEKLEGALKEMGENPRRQDNLTPSEFTEHEGALREMGENPRRQDNVTPSEFTEHEGALREMAKNSQRQDNVTQYVIPARPSSEREGNASTSLESEKVEGALKKMGEKPRSVMIEENPIKQHASMMTLRRRRVTKIPNHLKD